MISFHKKHKNRAEWREIITRWNRTGMAVGPFCQQERVTQGRFYYWRKHFGFGAATKSASAVVRYESNEPPVKFLPVQVKGFSVAEVTKSPTVTPERMEIFLANGAVVRINGQMSDDNLSRIMKVVMGTSC